MGHSWGIKYDCPRRSCQLTTRIRRSDDASILQHCTYSPSNSLGHTAALQCAQARSDPLTKLGWARCIGTRLGTLHGVVCPREVWCSVPKRGWFQIQTRLGTLHSMMKCDGICPGALSVKGGILLCLRLNSITAVIFLDRRGCAAYL